MTQIVHITRRVSIPRSEIRFKFTRSGGHGGQNVNKVETRVELYFDVTASPSLTEEDRGTILRRLDSRLDKKGVLRITVQESRSQTQNRERAIARFTELLSRALRTVAKRVATGVPRASKERRLEEKKRRGASKRSRRVVLE